MRPLNRSARRNTSARNNSNRLTHKTRLWTLPLEMRDVPATFTVATTADSGAGSLREILGGGQGVLAAGDVIRFDTSVFSSSQTISLTSGQLPAINVPITIQPAGLAT